MKWGTSVGVTFAVLFMIGYEWPKFRQYSKREKRAFAMLAAFGWVLTLLLVLFPDLPGPTQLVDFLFGPLGKLVE
ncbi:hypothetical protein [Paenibacillus oleatilyticus]|uniref:Preprotein translocase subunit SecE n=1 Tax=Paenibacillus oleatilyticus TaxID=2594886 RepID=A0ABV4V3B8_9BACL